MGLLVGLLFQCLEKGYEIPHDKKKLSNASSIQITITLLRQLIIIFFCENNLIFSFIAGHKKMDLHFRDCLERIRLEL